jgi:hypothetical protein
MKNIVFVLLVILLGIYFLSYRMSAKDDKLTAQEIDQKLQELYKRYHISYNPYPDTKEDNFNSKKSPKKAPSKKNNFFSSSHKYPFLKKSLLKNRKALAKIKGSYQLVILKQEYLMLLYKGSRFIKAYRIGIGMNKDGAQKQKPNDNRTPEGHFYIEKKHNSRYWEFKGKRAYGPWFLRLKTPPWKGIGIHGTDTMDALGRKSTHGCIRTDNNSITELKVLLPLKTKVHIYHSAADFDLPGLRLPCLQEVQEEILRND